MDDPVGTHAEHFFGHVVVAAFEGVFEAPVLFTVQVGEDAVLVGEASVGSGEEKRKET